MAHIRQLIRDNIVSTLTGLATTGQKVYKSRVYPINEAGLPALAIYTLSEESTYLTITPPRTIDRRLAVAVEIYVKSVSSYDDSLDTICSEIEAALYADTTRGGYAKDTRVSSFEADFSGEGDQPMMAARLTVDVQYTSTEGSPTG